MGAAVGRLQRRALLFRRALHLRRRPQPVAHQDPDRPERAAQLPAEPRAQGSHAPRSHPQVRQTERRIARRIRHAGRRQPEVRRMAGPLRGRHVVPGSVDLRLPADRDVHHPVRHAAGRNLILRLQHRSRLAAHSREDVSERHHRRVVREERQARGLCQPAQGRAARGARTARLAQHSGDGVLCPVEFRKGRGQPRASADGPTGTEAGRWTNRRSLR